MLAFSAMVLADVIAVWQGLGMADMKWIEADESKGQLPDSDTWVLVASRDGKYAVVMLEFTDDSEGNGQPYWSAGHGDFDFDFHEYPYWCHISPPPSEP